MSPLRTGSFGRAILFSAFSSVASLGFGQSAPLSADDAVRQGLAKNPQVQAAKAGVLSALANYHSLSVLPPITGGVTSVSGTSTAPTLNGANTDTIVDVGDTFDLSGQRRYQAAGANSTFRSTLFQYQETLLSLEQQIRDAYWSLGGAQAQDRIADINLKDAQRVYDLTVQQEKAGASPKGDVVRSTIDVANARQALITAQGAERSALVAFNTLLARPPTEVAMLNVDLGAESTAPPQVTLPELKDLDKQADANRPLMKSAIAQTKAANYAFLQAQASRWPDLAVSYQRSVQDQLDAVTLSLSLPLIDFGSVSSSIKAAKESKRQAEAQQVQTKQQIAQQVAQAHADLDVAIRAAADYKSQIVDPSTTLLGMAKLGYEQGATGILPVMDAESTLRNARTGYVSALVAVYKAQDEILAATGTGAMGFKPSNSPKVK